MSENFSIPVADDSGVQFKQEGDNCFVELDTVQEKLQKRYLAYLAEEGYKAEVDKDGDVLFKYEGKYYFIDTDTNNNEDGLCFQVYCPNFWEIESEEERRRALSAANAVNSRAKIGKVYIIADDTWARVALLLQSPEQFKDFFDRALLALQGCVSDFRQKMHKDDDDSEDESDE